MSWRYQPSHPCLSSPVMTMIAIKTMTMTMIAIKTMTLRMMITMIMTKIRLALSTIAPLLIFSGDDDDSHKNNDTEDDDNNDFEKDKVGAINHLTSSSVVDDDNDTYDDDNNDNDNDKIGKDLDRCVVVVRLVVFAI